jgi:hypothetical protein
MPDGTALPLPGSIDRPRVSTWRARVRRKVAVGASGDHYEQEADRMGELAARGQVLPPISPLAETGIEVEREGMTAQEPGGAIDGELEARLRQRDGLGSPLPATTRAAFEDRFGADFSAVRIHADTDADGLSNELDAIAFTHGWNVYFSAGTYRPGTSDGDRLLGHELTHVVQQSGGSGGTTRGSGTRWLQRAGVKGFEAKPYRGLAVHGELEGSLRKANTELITEAPIPGGTTSKTELDALGSADLYRSSDPKAVVGVRGHYEKEQTLLEQPRLDYVGVKDPRARLGSGKPVSKPTVANGRFSGDLPESFSVADIKPLAPEKFLQKTIHIGPKVGEGTVQVANYLSGFRRFAEEAYRDHARTGVTRATVTGSRLTGLAIPSGLDYAHFDEEVKKPSPSQGAFIAGRSRYWIYELPNLGLYVYFTLPHPYQAGEYQRAIDKVFAALRPVVGALRGHKKSIDPKLNLVRPKRRARRAAGAATAGATLRRARGRGMTTGARPLHVQRQAATGTDWTAEAEKWEQGRKKWDVEFGKPFLAKEGKAVGERVAVDEVLGLGARHALSGGSTETKEFRSIELWSGATGVLVGKGRFLLGASFDRIIQFYERIAARFRGLHERLTGTKAPGFGWKKLLVNALLTAAKLGFREILTGLYRIFATCFTSVMHRVIDEFVEELEETHAEELKELHETFDRFRDEFITTFEKHFGSWEEFVSTLADVSKWTSIVLGVVDLVRLIIQAVSCATPPALGCLWGLLANLASEAALEIGVPLILDTQRFRDEVIQPKVQELLKDVAGEQIQGVIAWVLGKVGLERYVQGPKGVAECHTAAKPPDLAAAVSQNLPPVVTGDALVAKRDAWERENQSKLVAAIRPALRNSSGATPSEGEVIALVDVLRRSRLPGGRLRGVLAASKDETTGKYDMDAIRSGVERAVAPSGPIPSITAVPAPPTPGGGVRFGPLTPVPPPGEPDRGREGGAVGVTIRIPGT